MYSPSQNFVIWENKFEKYNFFANNVFSVKDAKVLH
jgi:aminopeptidase C